MDLIELTNTRHNPEIDPGLHIWGWEIPIYLYLGGLVAGLMIISGIRLVLMRPKERHAMVCCTIGPLMALALLSIGMLALFLDLSHKLYVWRLYLTFELTSPMSWGSWILLLVYPALIANTIAHLPEVLPVLAKRFPILVTWSDFILARQRFVLGIGLSNMLVGIGLGIYTGILLGALGARPLWGSSLLGPLFLFSGLSTAAALLHGILIVVLPKGERPHFADFLLSSLARWSQGRAPDTAPVSTLAKADNSFLTIELGIIGLFFIGLLGSTETHRQAADLLLTGPYAATFWVGVIGIGIIIPLYLQFLEMRHKIRHTLVPSALVLIGGLILRFVLVYAGQESHWIQVATP